eukprot:scaffold18434_cov90-Amphora_coffeaeformis.AAC.1
MAQWTASTEILASPERCAMAMETALLRNRNSRSTMTDLWFPRRAVAEEGGASVGGNEEAEANTEENLFHECGSECGGVEGDDFRDDGEPSEVAHGGKEVLGAVVCGDGAGLPDVDVDDGKGR